MACAHPFIDEVFPIPWSKLTTEQMTIDINHIIKQSNEAIENLVGLADDQISFESVFLRLFDVLSMLDRGWSRARVLNATMKSAEVSTTYGELLPVVTGFQSSVMLNAGLLKVLKRSAELVRAKGGLDEKQERVIAETLLDFVMDGADLSTEDKAKVANINTELSSLGKQFVDKVTASRVAFEHYIDHEKNLAGLPELERSAAKESAEEKGQPDKWRFTLDLTSYMAVMKYADDESFRKLMWNGLNAVGTGQWDTEEIIWNLLRLRSEKAALFGFKHWPDYILSRRMAKNGESARRFVEKLHDSAKRQFLEDHEDLKQFIGEKTGQKVEGVDPWCTSYWVEKQQKELYDFDSQLLRPYFSVDKVIAGLFKIVSEIYRITIDEMPTFCGEEVKDGAVEVWHPDVRLFYVRDSVSGTHIGTFYADLYPREIKRGGAWMGGIEEGLNGKPHVCYIAGNLQKPVNGEMALLSQMDVETLFHEFGHACHLILDETGYSRLSSMSVAWDFVELPSQIMENWVWERSAVDMFAENCDGEKIPDKLFANMMRARNHRAGSVMMRQLSLGKLDFDFHMNYEQYIGRKIDEVEEEMTKDYVIKVDVPYVAKARNFSHLFGSAVGYSAGYYSYMWASILEADAFSRFKEEGVLNAEIGMQFRQKILSRGNSAPADVLFRDFMGRDPDVAALLERNGIKP